MNIRDYAIFVHCQTYKGKINKYFPEGLTEENIYDSDRIQLAKMACNFYGLNKLNNHLKAYKNGKEIFNNMPKKVPMVGLNVRIWSSYYRSNKDEFEKICLLGFLALKSIIQNKAYCKIDNKYWLSRMDGKAKSINDYSELSSQISKYNNEYQTKKIKNELNINWGLEHYGRYTRGFYFSFNLSLDQLVYQAELRRKVNQAKQRKLLEQNALKNANNKLNNRERF